MAIYNLGKLTIPKCPISSSANELDRYRHLTVDSGLLKTAPATDEGAVLEIFAECASNDRQT